MRCPWCEACDDKVVDSREVEGGTAVRRRRQCGACGRRFTTVERATPVGPVVRKRSGVLEPFVLDKLRAGVHAACKNRPLPSGALDRLVNDVAERVRTLGPEIGSEQIGAAVLERLSGMDQVAYLRFASVYKGFEGPSDFLREADLLSAAETIAHASLRGSEQRQRRQEAHETS